MTIGPTGIMNNEQGATHSISAMFFDATPSSLAAQTPLPVGISHVPEWLAGHWTNVELDLDIDFSKQLARVNDGTWEPFQIKDLSAKMLVFAVGREQFIGLMGADAMTVSRLRDGQSRALYRSYIRSTLKS